MGKSKRFNNINPEESFYKKSKASKGRRNLSKNQAFDPDAFSEDDDENFDYIDDDLDDDDF